MHQTQYQFYLSILHEKHSSDTLKSIKRQMNINLESNCFNDSQIENLILFLNSLLNLLKEVHQCIKHANQAKKVLH